MTASLRTTTNYSIALGGASPLLVHKTESPWPDVVLQLGNGHEIHGNRVEDFQSLKEAADRAIALFQS